MPVRRFLKSRFLFIFPGGVIIRCMLCGRLLACDVDGDVGVVENDEWGCVVDVELECTVCGPCKSTPLLLHTPAQLQHVISVC